MLTKNLAILAVASLAGNALGFNDRRHGHQHIHKREYLATEVETVTDWVTVTVWDGGPPASSTKASLVFVDDKPHTNSTITHASSTRTPTPTTTSSTVHTTPTSTTTHSPTTLLASVIKPSSTPVTTSTPKVLAPIDAAVTEAVSEVLSPSPSSSSSSSSSTSTNPTTSSTTSPVSSSTNKRGLAYNDGSLLSGFVGSGSKVSWAYNWGQTSDMSVDVEYCPMLWGDRSDFTSTWSTNANNAISSGSNCLLSFNEPDNAGQSNLSPSEAVTGHIQYMNPFQGKARIGAPAITNSATEGQGISWLTEFLSECAGKCAIDFIPIHWYNSADTQDFLSHLTAVHEAAPDYPVWITEFAPLGASDDEISQFLTTVMQAMDSDSTYSFVERYSYFMVEVGSLVSAGTTLSSFGETYAYAA